MSRNFVGKLLIFLLFFIGSLDTKVLSNTLSLGDGSVFEMMLTNDTTPYMKQISIAASSKAIFNVTNVSSTASFIIFQIHIYQHNVTLSFDKDCLDKVSNRSIFGSNIGLLSKLTTNIMTQFFVKNDNVHDVKALLVVIAYNNKAPVPGGCNMEFDTEIAPYARMRTRDAMVIVDVQPASLPFNSMPWTCEKEPVEVEMYQMYLPEQDLTAETYFTAEGVLKFISAVCFFVGLFFTFLGHHVSRVEKMFPIFFIGTVIGYAIEGNIIIGMAIGLLFNLLSLVCPYSTEHRNVAFLVNITLGLFFACVAYLHSPGSFVILQNNTVFWFLFLTLALGIAVVTTFCFCSYITCSIFSSFTIILPIDYWVGSSLKYIMINIVRRATVEDFNLAIVRPPIQTKDIWLIVFWICLALFHFYKHYQNQLLLNDRMTETTPLWNQY
ncbi:transmembrane 7 superfamily member 3 isoform X3 [Apis cerana]|uniref:transmembrane 7 superfamily member 3 isoform X3 n=1 Tax=Apis cerana TaxID=7461 RepID=UPI0007E2B89B|nr:transmembrane 7 superfamily member 3 isoform X3 [Apis cerana]XP_061932243.1 transmembrane 7 superfamily member 3 isoform X3 [Apis cerana]